MLHPLCGRTKHTATHTSSFRARPHLPLRKQTARLQTIRSIGLVREFSTGARLCGVMLPIRQLQPICLPATGDQPFPPDQSLLKGKPILIQWYPPLPIGGWWRILALLTTMLRAAAATGTGAGLTVAKAAPGMVGAWSSLSELKMKRCRLSSRHFPLSARRQASAIAGVQTSPAFTAVHIA